MFRPASAYRRRAISLLELRPGETVLDLGCGTGLSFDLIEEAVGPAGRLIGFDASEQMLARARKRVEACGRSNVRLVQGVAEELSLDELVDAILCFYTHDIMISPAAVQRAVGALKPGGRLVAAGGKVPSGLLGKAINLVPMLVSAPFVTRYRGIERPWQELERVLPSARVVEERMFGGAYIVKAVKEGEG